MDSSNMSSASSAPPACVVDDGDGTTTTKTTTTIVAASWPPTRTVLSSVISSSRLAFFGTSGVDDPSSFTTTSASALHDSCLMGLGIITPALFALLWVSTMRSEREIERMRERESERVSMMMHACCIHTIALMMMGDRASFHPPPLSLSTPRPPSPPPALLPTEMK